MNNDELTIKTQEEFDIEKAKFKRAFLNYFRLILQRYTHYEELVENRKSQDEICAYSDLLVVHLRALLIENPKYKKNYTLQNFLHKMGRDDLVNDLNNFLSHPIYDEWDLSLKTFIKIQADEFICHHDNVETGAKADQALESWFTAYLSNFNNEYCMKNIMIKLFNFIKESIESTTNSNCLNYED